MFAVLRRGTCPAGRRGENKENWSLCYRVERGSLDRWFHWCFLLWNFLNGILNYELRGVFLWNFYKMGGSSWRRNKGLKLSMGLGVRKASAGISTVGISAEERDWLSLEHSWCFGEKRVTTSVSCDEGGHGFVLKLWRGEWRKCVESDVLRMASARSGAADRALLSSGSSAPSGEKKKEQTVFKLLWRERNINCYCI